MRIYGNIQPVELSASDFTDDNYIGKLIKKHPKHGVIALLESRSNQPKRYVVMVGNRSTNFFLSSSKALNYYDSLK